MPWGTDVINLSGYTRFSTPALETVRLLADRSGWPRV